MAKSYPERLGEWVKKRKSTQRDKNLVAFLAVRDDVKAAVDAGYAVKTVWANMHETEQIECGYDTFLNYVNKLIRRPQVDQANTLAGPASPVSTESSSTKSTKPKAGVKKSTAKTTEPAAPTGFTFNPVPNKQELL